MNDHSKVGTARVSFAIVVHFAKEVSSFYPPTRLVVVKYWAFAILSNRNNNNRRKQLMEEESGTVNVAIRIRPLSEKEKERGDINAWGVSDNRDRLVTSEKLQEYIEKEGSLKGGKSAKAKSRTPLSHRAGSSRKRSNTATKRGGSRKRTVNPNSTKRKIPSFKEGNVFDSSFDTSSLFEEVGKPVVKEAMRGINGTILAYGQTSSGKTHTMLGNHSTPGVILLSVIDIFRHINETPDRAFLLRVSMVEIYNEIVRDLLNPKATRLQVYNDKHRGVLIQGVKEEIVTSPDHVWQLLDTGFGNRAVGATGLNEESSRSHTVFRLVIESRDAKENPANKKGSEKIRVRVSTLNIVDLAGSERTADAGTTGGRRKEGMNINKSLMTLGSVIRKLVNDPDGHIPYRNSQLTRILRRSLGGNAKTAIVCTIAPSQRHFEESRTTLAFAANANRVKSRAKVNEVDMRMSIMGAHEDEMTKLRQQLQNFGISSGGGQAASLAAASVATAGNAQSQVAIDEARETITAEAKEATALREQLESKLQELTKLVLTAAGHEMEDGRFGTTRHSDSGSSSVVKKRQHRVRQTWGPREWSNEFSKSRSFSQHRPGKLSGRTSNQSWRSASNFFDESDQLKDALDSMEEELEQVTGMLEGERQNLLEAESRAMKMDSELALLTDGVGIEDKSLEDLKELEEIYMQGIQRVLEARHRFTIERQRQEYEEELSAMKQKYDSDLEAFKAENSKEVVALKLENQSMKERLGDTTSKLVKTASAKKDMENRLVHAEEQYSREIESVKQRSLKTEIELRSKHETALQMQKQKGHGDVADENDTSPASHRTPLIERSRASLVQENAAGPSPIQLLFEKARKQSLAAAGNRRSILGKSGRKNPDERLV